jgi:hypothetical protein
MQQQTQKIKFAILEQQLHFTHQAFRKKNSGLPEAQTQ